MKITRFPWYAIFFLGLILVTNSVSGQDGIFSAITDDGVTLKLRRYRPSPAVNFAEDKIPVLLFPGILVNMNQFLSCTPDDRKSDYADMVLPEPVAEWAENDPYIAEDPMLYYSLAHFLWLKGYDPWFANYRGTGRGELKSGKRTNLTTMDVWAILDVDASVQKVIEVTQKNLFIGGHSTGGFTCYAYLQGTYFDLEELEAGYAGGYLPHIKSDPELAKIRNSKVKGYIAIDPGTIPSLPEIIDFPAMWKLFNKTYYLDLDWLIEKVANPIIADSDVYIATVDMIFGTIYTLDKYFGKYLKILSQIDVWYPHNTHPYIDDFWVRYCASSTYFRTLSHWGDISLNHAIREHWKNGSENIGTIIGPEPDPGNDGYYYYDQHMHYLTVPTIALLSYAPALVEADDVINLLMNAKTPNEYDEYHHIPDTAHLDISNGLNAPTHSFPIIGEWLDTVCSEDSNPLPNAANETQNIENTTDKIQEEAYSTDDDQPINEMNDAIVDLQNSPSEGNGESSACFIGSSQQD